MNQELWNNILSYNFDSSPSEYGFTTRLAAENFWSESFTTQAILEYKKFMYLAATSDNMVSPSEIVDIVWHQHLIFTKSYQEFCDLIGKQIQHIPSTHNKNEYAIFKAAKERTKELYETEFGTQPYEIWGNNSMYDALYLDKAKFKIRTFLVIGILGFMAICFPAYLLLKPIYKNINSTNFILGLFILTILTTIILEYYNQFKLQKIVESFSSKSFIYSLEPKELIYLETQKLNNVVNIPINELVEKGIIDIKNTTTFEIKNFVEPNDIYQLQVLNSINDLVGPTYSNVLNFLLKKPLFKNVANCMDAFKKYFNKSKKFGQLFYINYIALAVICLLAVSRIIIGVSRDKPVLIISLITILIFILTAFYLNRLTKLVCTKTIPNLYKENIVTEQVYKHNWQWEYFLYGNAALSIAFLPTITHYHQSRSLGSNSDSSCSSCGGGNSCGSSCGGSGCGGCGGGD